MTILLRRATILRASLGVPIAPEIFTVTVGQNGALNVWGYGPSGAYGSIAPDTSLRDGVISYLVSYNTGTSVSFEVGMDDPSAEIAQSFFSSVKVETDVGTSTFDSSSASFSQGGGITTWTWLGSQIWDADDDGLDRDVTFNF